MTPEPTGPTPEQDLVVLAADAAAGDRAAFTALVRATQRDIMRFMSSLADRREVEDLTQETFLRAFRALPGFAGRWRAPARTWSPRCTRRGPAAAALSDRLLRDR